SLGSSWAVVPVLRSSKRHARLAVPIGSVELARLTTLIALTWNAERSPKHKRCLSNLVGRKHHVDRHRSSHHHRHCAVGGIQRLGWRAFLWHWLLRWRRPRLLLVI